MKVYFNGSCNICNAEISHYKKKTCDINYVDISKDKDEHINHLSKKDLFRISSLKLSVFLSISFSS